MSDDTLNNNQSEITTLKKKSSVGGRRPGAGRPTGSTNKVSTPKLVADFQQRTGQNWAEYMHQWIIDLRAAGNDDMAARLAIPLNKYHLDDEPQKVDVTSNGQTMAVSPIFPKADNPGFPDNI